MALYMLTRWSPNLMEGKRGLLPCGTHVSIHSTIRSKLGSKKNGQENLKGQINQSRKHRIKQRKKEKKFIKQMGFMSSRRRNKFVVPVPVPSWRIDNPMYRRNKGVVCPSLKHVSYVYHQRARNWAYVHPCPLLIQKLQTASILWRTRGEERKQIEREKESARVDEIMCPAIETKKKWKTYILCKYGTASIITVGATAHACLVYRRRGVMKKTQDSLDLFEDEEDSMDKSYSWYMASYKV